MAQPLNQQEDLAQILPLFVEDREDIYANHPFAVVYEGILLDCGKFQSNRSPRRPAQGCTNSPAQKPA